MNLNKNLRKASKTKNDEFYTQLKDIEKELRHYMFLASINSNSAELNFPSTPIPLMGFHG